jgi:hypothetical protein
LEVLDRIIKKEFEFNTEELFSNLFSFFENNLEEILDTKEFLNLSLDLMIKICSSEKILVSEARLFEGIIAWGKKQDEKNLKKTIEKLIPLIRYPFMSTFDLTNLVKPYDIDSKLYSEALEFNSSPESFSKNKSLQFKSRFSFFP